MSLTDDLYRETILDHYHRPRNQGILDNSSIKVEGVNPLCGDELTLYFNVDGEKITEVAIKSRGCSINTASSSMMTEVIKGHSLAEIEKMIAAFKDMMMEGSQDTPLPEEMEELEALQGVKKYPVRIKCALLPWNTLIEGLRCLHENADSGKEVAPHVVSTE